MPRAAALKATDLKCDFGCTDPATCPFPHRGCVHCEKARAGLGYDPVDAEAAMSTRWAKGHPAK